jgi:hypothetical protein
MRPDLREVIPKNHLGLLCLCFRADRLELLQVLILEIDQK